MPVTTKEEQVKKAISTLESRFHLVQVMNEWQIRVNRVDFWPTTGKWYDSVEGKKGVGMRTYLNYIEDGPGARR